MNVTKLRALLEAATPGPWARNKQDTRLDYIESDECEVAMDCYRSDAALIVEMRNSLPALLDRLDKLEAVAEANKKLLKHANIVSYEVIDSCEDERVQELNQAIHNSEVALAELEKVGG